MALYSALAVFSAGTFPGVLVYIETAPRHPWPVAFDRDTAMDSNGAHRLLWKVEGHHVYPINDFREHLLEDCWCRPIGDDGVVVHNSLDGRELYERGERKRS